MTKTTKNKALNSKPIFGLFFIAVMMIVNGNAMAMNEVGKDFKLQAPSNKIVLAGTTWNGIGNGVMPVDEGTCMDFIVKMKLEFVNETDAKMNMDVFTTISGVETEMQKDVKATLKYTFDGKSKGTMYLKQNDLVTGAEAKRPFAFTYNNNGTITLDCWLFEGMGISRYELTKKMVLEIIETDDYVSDIEIGTIWEDGAVETIDIGLADEVVEEEIFTIVEEMPSFPGGDAKMMEYISKNIKYPQIARETGVQGRVFIGMVVEPDGSITNVKVIRGIGCGCDEEAIRVVKSMPKWNPGKQRGKAVRVSYQLPVNFRLQ